MDNKFNKSDYFRQAILQKKQDFFNEHQENHRKAIKNLPQLKLQEIILNMSIEH